MRQYHLFDVFGLELEYMVVDRHTLAVRPIVDELFRTVAGSYVSDIDRDQIAWSNELAGHVVELKTNGPVTDLTELVDPFEESVRAINKILSNENAMLLPGGAHPLMDPLKETTLWPHESREIYRLYDRIFGCRGHGWSNLQSTHLNLPFVGDGEFSRLHAAIRVLLPIMPAIAASTPILEGRLTGFADTRLEVYRVNQARIPSLTGVVIPEPVFTEADYRTQIFDPIVADVRPFDTDGILDRHFLNSRGAIARFDRGSIEIRVLDIQECPAADVAIASLISSVLKAMTEERWSTLEDQQKWTAGDLAEIFLDNIRLAERATPGSSEYQGLFGTTAALSTSGDLWRHIVGEVGAELPPAEARVIDIMLEHGTLATRIAGSVSTRTDRAGIAATYSTLAECLESGQMFLPPSNGHA